MTPYDRMGNTKVIRIGQEAVQNLLIVVKCDKTFKARFRLAMWIMKIAGRIGGFKSIKAVRDTRD